jgi:hemoglobin
MLDGDWSSDVCSSDLVGQPFLRARHMPFSIGEAERDQWLLCMRQAVDEQIHESPFRDTLWEAIAGLANHMRNK